MIQIIVFSFNRALQLDTLLSSLLKRCKSPECQIDVVYNYSTKEFEDGYKLLKEKFSDKGICLYKESTLHKDKVHITELLNIENLVRFYRNTSLRHPKSNFRSLVIKLLEESNTENIMFLTDDSMFVSDFTIPDRDLRWINEAPMHRQFSLRLGKGVSPLPEKVRLIGDYCEWNMYENINSWGYPFSVDAHIYNRLFILSLLKKYIFCNPSTLESDIVSSVRRAGFLETGRCFSDIKMRTFPINIVQTSVNNLCQDVSVEMLNERYLNGDVMDYCIEDNYDPTKQYVKTIKFTNKDGHVQLFSINSDLIRPNS